MVMQRASKTSTGASSQTTGTPAARRNSGAPTLRIGAAAESEYDRFVKLENAPESGAQLVGFDLAKSRLAKALEYFRDAQFRSLLDAIVEIDKAPRQLTREQCADGGFARAHEAGEAEHLYARLSRT